MSPPPPRTPVPTADIGPPSHPIHPYTIPPVPGLLCRSASAGFFVYRSSNAIKSEPSTAQRPPTIPASHGRYQRERPRSVRPIDIKRHWMSNLTCQGKGFMVPGSPDKVTLRWRSILRRIPRKVRLLHHRLQRHPYLL